MTLSGLAALVTSDPTLSAALETARTRPSTLPTLDLTGPPALRPFLVAGLASATGGGRRGHGAHRARRHRHPARGRGAGRGARRPARPARGRPVPGVGDAAARAAVAALRHRRSPARGAAPARAPGRPGHPHRPAAGDRGAGPLGAAAAGERAGRPRAGAAARSATRSTSKSSSRRLAGAAYHRVDLVERRGEFAVRGGIVDVFPPTEEHPLRVEFWGDTVEEVRSFSVADQRSLEARRRAVGAAVPRAAAHRRRRRVRALAEQVGRRSTRRWPRCSPGSPTGTRSRAWSRSPRCWSTGWRCSPTCCPAASHVVVFDPERVRARAPRPGGDQRGVPAGVVGGGGRRGRGAGRPGRQRLPLAGRRPRRAVAGGLPVVEHVAVRSRPDRARPGAAAYRRRRHRLDRPRRRPRSGDVAVGRPRAPRRSTAATPRARSTTCADGSPRAVAWSS